jgi:hypothetical protein
VIAEHFVDDKMNAMTCTTKRFCVAVLAALCGCSTNGSGLGMDAGESTGGRTGGPGTGGRGGVGSGGASGTGGAATGSGGAGGRAGTGGAATGSGGAGGRAGTGGAATGSGGAGGRAGTGGAATGSGGAGGRAGTGGAATGGRPGTGGGAGGAGGVAPECRVAGDCHLYSDCCACEALAPGELPPPACPAVCVVGRCTQLGLSNDAVDCVAGRCVAGFDCDATKVTCKVAIPACPAGETPIVTGSCYTGQCAPVAECRVVGDCQVCSAAGLSCVVYETQMGNQAHCVTIPVACNGDATCACLGQTACITPYRACANFSGVKGITCGCPNC